MNDYTPDDETITIPCRTDSTVARFIALVDGLPEDLKAGLVLIGGLSVTCRLGFEYRVTNDVDGLYFNHSAASIEEVLLAHRVSTDGHRVLLDDRTKLDVIEVADFEVESLPDNPSDRLFIEAHRWAYDTANTVTITTTDPNLGSVHSTVTVRMARTAALVVMKLRAALARPRSNETKKASDSQDAYLLLQRLDQDGDLASAVVLAPWDIVELTSDCLQRLFLENAEMTAGRINRWMNLTEPTQPDDLRRVATRFLHGLG